MSDVSPAAAAAAAADVAVGDFARPSGWCKPVMLDELTKAN